MIEPNRTRKSGEGISLHIESKLAEELSPSSIKSAAFDLVKAMEERSKRVISKRFGLDGMPAKTLHSIGDEEGVTRERIRQIEQFVLESLKKGEGGSAKSKRVREALQEVMNLLGGVAREEVLDEIFGLKEGVEKSSLRFLLRTLPKISEIRESSRLTHHFAQEKCVPLNDILEKAEKYLKENSNLVSDESLISKLKENFPAISENALRSALSVGLNIVRTPFGDWGIRGWIEATPRGVGDKAYVVLKREKEPRHFVKITELINEAKFDRRVAHPQTVHNELIRDERFVLVGRGLYALKEWGYQAGTVADVLERILRKSTAPMLKEDLVDAVLKERIVKRNTILLALQNRKRFARTSSGHYALIEAGTLTKSFEQDKNQKQIGEEPVSEESKNTDFVPTSPVSPEDINSGNN